MVNSGLPAVRRVGWAQPFRWLGGGFVALWRSWPVSLAYGLAVALLSVAVAGSLILSHLSYWALALTCGFVFVAPVLAMGNYETARRLERGEKLTLAGAFIVPQAFRQDVAYLGMALFLIFGFWIQAAQIVYGLNTFQIHRTLKAFVQFAIGTEEGHSMLAVGTLVGGAIAFITYVLVVVSAPMLLDRRYSVFEATVTSVRAVNENVGPMLLWALIIAVLTLGSAATGFAALVVVFPWLGLSSWRAYRDLVAPPEDDEA